MDRGSLKSEEFKMEDDQELRFDVAEGGHVTVELLEGLAEIFGSEILPNRKYSFSSGSRVAVFSWQGCRVELVGDFEGAYVAKQTPMIIYLNTHSAIEQMRADAEKYNRRGPRVMICGPTDVGKSTVCRIMLNYTCRKGRCPIFVDLDVGQGQVSIPGTIGALYIERVSDPVEGFDKRAPLVYHFGHLSPADNIPFYNLLVSKLAESVNAKCNVSMNANVGGVIINTCGWVKGTGYQCLVHAAEAFEIDVVIVLDHERLYNELQKDLPGFVRIVHQPKSGGIEERSRENRVQARRERIRDYFYGTKRAPLFPHTFEVGFSEINVFKVGAPSLPDSCMPLGMKAEDTRLKVVSVQPSREMQHHILAVSQCEVVDHDMIRESNIAGFVCVSEVNIERQVMSILSPQPYPLPRNILLWSDISYLDSMS